MLTTCIATFTDSYLRIPISILRNRLIMPSRRGGPPVFEFKYERLPGRKGSRILKLKYVHIRCTVTWACRSFHSFFSPSPSSFSRRSKPSAGWCTRCTCMRVCVCRVVMNGWVPARTSGLFSGVHALDESAFFCALLLLFIFGPC